MDDIDSRALEKFGRATLFHIFEPYHKKAKKARIKQGTYVDLVSPYKNALTARYEAHRAFYEKYGITPGGKLIDRKWIDNNWMNPWEEMWQDPRCCSSGIERCLKQNDSDILNEDFRCITCGFYCHSMCRHEILIGARQKPLHDPQLNSVCFKCKEKLKLKTSNARNHGTIFWNQGVISKFNEKVNWANVILTTRKRNIGSPSPQRQTRFQVTITTPMEQLEKELDSHSKITNKNSPLKSPPKPAPKQPNEIQDAIDKAGEEEDALAANLAAEEREGEDVPAENSGDDEQNNDNQDSEIEVVAVAKKPPDGSDPDDSSTESESEKDTSFKPGKKGDDSSIDSVVEAEDSEAAKKTADVLKYAPREKQLLDTFVQTNLLIPEPETNKKQRKTQFAEDVKRYLAKMVSKGIAKAAAEKAEKEGKKKEPKITTAKVAGIDPPVHPSLLSKNILELLGMITDPPKHGVAEIPTNYTPDERIVCPRNFEDIPEAYRDFYISFVHDPELALKIWIAHLDPKKMKNIDSVFQLMEMVKYRDTVKTQTLRRLRSYPEAENHVQFPVSVKNAEYLMVNQTLYMFANYWWPEIGCKKFGRAVWLPKYGDPPNERKRKRLVKQIETKIAHGKATDQKKNEDDNSSVVEESPGQIAARKEERAIQDAVNKVALDMYQKMGAAANNPVKVKECFDLHWLPESSELTAEEKEELKKFFKTMRGKQVKKQYYENKKEYEQVAELQFIRQSTNNKFAHYKARIYDANMNYYNSTLEINPAWVEWNFREDFYNLVMKHPGQWMHVPVGAPREDIAPQTLQTMVEVKYLQQQASYCLCYSLASALHYMGLEKEGEKVAALAPDSLNLPREKQFQYLRLHVQDIIPSIGMYQQFGRVLKKKKTTKELTIPEVIQKPTPYPTIVVPLGMDSGVSHAVCIVDDLIFDSTQHFALMLTHKSFHWICGKKGANTQLFGAVRFFGPMRSNIPKLVREMRSNNSAMQVLS